MLISAVYIYYFAGREIKLYKNKVPSLPSGHHRFFCGEKEKFFPIIEMNTRTFSHGLCCDRCDFQTNTTDDELQLRNHYQYNHKGSKFKIKNFRPLKGNVVKSTVNIKTMEKRKRIGLKFGCTNVNPRRCHSFNKSGKQCSNFVISPAETTQSVRCIHHPQRDIAFAKSTGIFGSPLSYVTVKQSTITGGGNGVFSTALGGYNEGDFITQYCGDLMSEAQVTTKKHNQEHTIYCSAFSLPYLSGLNSPVVGKGVGSFINRRDDANASNTKFVYRFAKTEEESVWIVAVKTILPNEELFISYGNSFKIAAAKLHAGEIC